MRKEDLDHQINKLPKQYMTEDQKQNNLTMINRRMKEPKRNNHWMAYPLTVAMIGLLMFIGFLFIGGNNPVNAPENEHSFNKYAELFEGHKPLVDITHITDGEIKGHELSIVAGYLFNASSFLDQDFNEVNPIKTNESIDQFLNDLLNNINENQLYSSKKTWVYLMSANQILESASVKERHNTEPLSQLIDDWIHKLEQINRDRSFEENEKLYKEVVTELTYLVRSIQEMSPKSTVYKGQSQEMEVNLQQVDESEHVITFFYQPNPRPDELHLGQTTITIKDGAQEIVTNKLKVEHGGGTYLNFNIPTDLGAVNDLKIIIEWKDQRKTVDLKKEIY